MTINSKAAALTVGVVWGVLGMFVTGVGNPPRSGLRPGAPGRDGLGLSGLHGNTDGRAGDYRHAVRAPRWRHRWSSLCLALQHDRASRRKLSHGLSNQVM